MTGVLAPDPNDEVPPSRMNPFSPLLTGRVPTTTRLRLPADIRVQQILDAALAAFSLSGFTATRMEDIARRAGLSKGGLYAHFRSKDDVFEALLARSLPQRALYEDDFWKTSASLRETLEHLVDSMYATLTQPTAMATLRLLVAESERVPQVVAQWQRDVIEPHIVQTGEILRQAALREGRCGDSLIVRHPWLAISPAVHVILSQLIFGTRTTTRNLPERREEHIQMLWELLGPHP